MRVDSVARNFGSSSFLIEPDADSEEGVDGEEGPDRARAPLMRVEVEQIKQRLHNFRPTGVPLSVCHESSIDNTRHVHFVQPRSELNAGNGHRRGRLPMGLRQMWRPRLKSESCVVVIHPYGQTLSQRL